jgi:5-methylcytosine-specific restriction endonuclease McrA
MTTEYQTLLATDQWQQKRQQILKRDDYKCCCCNSTQNLQIHHRQYHFVKASNSKQNPWEYKSRYLITLCEKCHQRGHELFKIPFFSV